MTGTAGTSGPEVSNHLTSCNSRMMDAAVFRKLCGFSESWLEALKMVARGCAALKKHKRVCARACSARACAGHVLDIRLHY